MDIRGHEFPQRESIACVGTVPTWDHESVAASHLLNSAELELT